MDQTKKFQFRHPLLPERPGSKRGQNVKVGLAFIKTRDERSVVIADIRRLVEAAEPDGKKLRIPRVHREAFRLFYERKVGRRWEADFETHARRPVAPSATTTKLRRLYTDGEKTIARLIKILEQYDERLTQLCRTANYIDEYELQAVTVPRREAREFAKSDKRLNMASEAISQTVDYLGGERCGLPVYVEQLGEYDEEG